MTGKNVDELRARLRALKDAPDFNAAAVECCFALVKAWPAIDALLTRLTAAEAERDQLHEWIDTAVCGQCGGPVHRNRP